MLPIFPQPSSATFLWDREPGFSTSTLLAIELINSSFLSSLPKTKPAAGVGSGLVYDGCAFRDLSVHSYPSAQQDTRERVCGMRPVGRGKHARTIADGRFWRKSVGAAWF